MTSFDKHKAYFISITNQLVQQQNLSVVRQTIGGLMQYLETNHLVDKYYLDKKALFVKCETSRTLIDQQTAEDLLSFLTIIYRMEYITFDSDPYMIYYRNEMLNQILEALIKKL